MPPAGERGDREPAGVVGKGQQRVGIAAAGAGRQDAQLVDDLFARRLNAREQDPDARMEPERGTNDFLADRPEPVAPADVPQLVREHGALNGHGLTAERGRQQDDRRTEAERQRLTEMWNEADRGGSRDGGCEIVAGLERSGGLTSAAQAAQAPESRSDPREAQRHPGRDEHHRGIGQGQRHPGADLPRRRRPDACCGRSRRRHRCLARRDLLDARLHERQRQADDEQRAQEVVAHGRCVEAQQADGGKRHGHENRGLEDPRGEVGEREHGHSSISSISRRMASLSDFESLASFARCTSSGPAAPSKTRSRKSRTIAPTTCWAGFAGRYS